MFNPTEEFPWYVGSKSSGGLGLSGPADIGAWTIKCSTLVRALSVPLAGLGLKLNQIATTFGSLPFSVLFYTP